MTRPLCIDLFCGLGGWTEGFLAEGYRVIGFDIEARPYPGELVLQDILTVHGSQFRNAAVIVASPPCQEFSYRAQPWKRAKAQMPKGHETPNWWDKSEGQMTPAELEEWRWWKKSRPLPPPSTALFEACFRIQREAIAAANHHIPLVVENVKGAQPWVGPARAHFGSFYLWGDIDSVGGSIVAGGVRFGNVLRPGKRGTGGKQNPDGTDHPQGSWFKIADSKNRAKNGSKNDGGSWFNIANNTESGHGRNPDGRKVGLYSDPRRNGGKGSHPTSPRENLERIGVKQHGSGAEWFDTGIAKHSSKGNSRKQASAEIAMIPPPLARHVAASFKPR